MLKNLKRAVMATILLLGLMTVGAPPADAQDCSNEDVRVQLGMTALPDCRAYELITPGNSNGRSVEGISDFRFQPSGALFPTELLTPSGNDVAFMTFNGPLGGVGGRTGTLDVTGVRRSPSGWEITRRLSPGAEQAVSPIPGGISADHLYAFTEVGQVFKPGDNSGTLPGGTLAAGGRAQYPSSPDGSFGLIGIGSVGGLPVNERLAQG